MSKPNTCTFIKRDQTRCKALALPGLDRCRWHKDAAADTAGGGQVFGVIDRRLVEAEPGAKPEFYEDFNTYEIVNYVSNATGGRVQIPLHLSRERIIAQAVEALA